MLGPHHFLQSLLYWGPPHLCSTQCWILRTARIESRKKCIKIDEVHKEYFKEFIDFLHSGETTKINIEKSADLKRLVALVTLAEKYQVTSLLEYLLFKVTDAPSKKDIFNRLKVLTLCKRICTYRESGESLMAWIEHNMNKTEIREIMSKFLF